MKTLTNQQIANRDNKTLVVGTGHQAPYGIGEIIKVFGTSSVSVRRAQIFAARWYNHAQVISPEIFFCKTCLGDGIFRGIDTAPVTCHDCDGTGKEKR